MDLSKFPELVIMSLEAPLEELNKEQIKTLRKKHAR